VIGINTERDHATVKQFVESNISYPVLLDGQMPAQTYGVGNIPDTYYIDKEGIVRYRDLGFGGGQERELEKKIKELL
jgi:hypothetical protein